MQHHAPLCHILNNFLPYFRSTRRPPDSAYKPIYPLLTKSEPVLFDHQFSHKITVTGSLTHNRPVPVIDRVSGLTFSKHNRPVKNVQLTSLPWVNGNSATINGLSLFSLSMSCNL